LAGLIDVFILHHQICFDDARCFKASMILESLWFYVFLFIAGMVWLYLTE
jgi:hypothetical protein